MRPCVRNLTASANLSAARPQEFSLLTTIDILNSDLYWASSRAGETPAITMRRTTTHLILMPPLRDGLIFRAALPVSLFACWGWLGAWINSRRFNSSNRIRFPMSGIASQDIELARISRDAPE